MKALLALVLITASIGAQNILPPCSSWKVISNPNNMIVSGCSIRARIWVQHDITLRTPKFTTDRSGWYVLEFSPQNNDLSGYVTFTWKMTGNGDGQYESPQLFTWLQFREFRHIYMEKGKDYDVEIRAAATSLGSDLTKISLTRLRQLPDVRVREWAIAHGKHAAGWVGMKKVNLRSGSVSLLVVGASRYSKAVNIPGVTWPLWVKDPVFIPYADEVDLPKGVLIGKSSWQLLEISPQFQLALSPVWTIDKLYWPN